MAESGMAICYASSFAAMDQKIEQGTALCRALLPWQVLLIGGGYSVVRDGECMRCIHFKDCLEAEKNIKNSLF